MIGWERGKIVSLFDSKFSSKYSVFDLNEYAMWKLPLVQCSQASRKMSLLFYRWIFPLCTFQNQQFWCDHRHPVEHYPISNHDKWFRVNVKKIVQWQFRLHRICVCVCVENSKLKMKNPKQQRNQFVNSSINEMHA